MSSQAAQPAAYPLDPRSKNTSSTNAPETTTTITTHRSHSQGRTPWRTERRYTEIDDHTWKYTLDNESSGGSVVGFGNVRIPSEDNIAKLVDRKLSIRAITWNINEKHVKVLDLLADHLENISDNHLEDIIIIALQELPPSTTTFHEDALAIIVKPLGNTHDTFISYRAWSQMIFVFTRKAHTRFATEPVAQFVPATTLAKPVRTKGAIGVCMRLYQRWIVIIGCHLTLRAATSHIMTKDLMIDWIKTCLFHKSDAHEYYPILDSWPFFRDINFIEISVPEDASALQRIQDYHKVMKTLKFQALSSFKGSDDIFHADCVLWIGDLNFRITEDSGVEWKSQLQDPNTQDIESTMQHDELLLIRKKELAFAEFKEAPITFAPTHKFEIGTNDYVPNRIPSFTDRVLFWTRQSEWMECTSYRCIQKPCQSDHRPVYATFRLEVINKKSPRRYNSDQLSNGVSHSVHNSDHARNILLKENSSQT